MVESFSNFYIDTRVSIAQFDSLKKISIGLYFRLLRKVQNKIKNMIDVFTEKVFSENMNFNYFEHSCFACCCKIAHLSTVVSYCNIFSFQSFLMESSTFISLSIRSIPSSSPKKSKKL